MIGYRRIILYAAVLKEEYISMATITYLNQENRPDLLLHATLKVKERDLQSAAKSMTLVLTY